MLIFPQYPYPFKRYANKVFSYITNSCFRVSDNTPSIQFCALFHYKQRTWATCIAKQITQSYPLKPVRRHQDSTQSWGIWHDTGWFDADQNKKTTHDMNKDWFKKKKVGFTEKQIGETSTEEILKESTGKRMPPTAEHGRKPLEQKKSGKQQHLSPWLQAHPDFVIVFLTFQRDDCQLYDILRKTLS